MTTLGLSYLNYEEQKRSNLAKEAETARANLVNEARNRESLDETIRSNMANEAIAMRGQDVSMRGQDISAETTRRGQDISAATTERGQDISANVTTRGQDISKTLSEVANQINQDKLRYQVLSDLNDSLTKINPLAGAISVFNTWNTLFPNETLINFTDSDLWKELYSATEGTSLSKLVEQADKLFHSSDAALGEVFGLNDGMLRILEGNLGTGTQILEGLNKLKDALADKWDAVRDKSKSQIRDFFNYLRAQVNNDVQGVKDFFNKMINGIDHMEDDRLPREGVGGTF